MDGASETRADVASTVADLFGRETCALVGRATTGLFLLFEALGVEGEVLYPAYTCPSPVYAAQYAGATPTFCDVSRRDYNLTADAVADAVTDETEAVVAINMFGHPVEYDALADVCADRDLLLVEDACQSVGTEYAGQTAGSFGDVSLLSFGEKKPLDAGGGGAVLADDPSIVEAVRDRAADVPVRDEDRQEALYDHYRALYYEIEDLRSLTPRAERLFATLPEVFRELYLRGLPADRIPAIDAALGTYPETVETRREHAAIYRSTLEHPAIDHPDPAGNPVYYRYSIALSSSRLRDFVVEYLRDRDVHVSTLYDPIHQRFGDEGPHPVAEELSERTINLWVSGAVDEEYVRNAAETVLEAVETSDDE